MATGIDLSKILGGQTKILGGQKVVESDKCMGNSKLLGGTCPGCPLSLRHYANGHGSLRVAKHHALPITDRRVVMLPLSANAMACGHSMLGPNTLDIMLSGMIGIYWFSYMCVPGPTTDRSSSFIIVLLTGKIISALNLQLTV